MNIWGSDPEVMYDVLYRSELGFGFPQEPTDQDFKKGRGRMGSRMDLLLLLTTIKKIQSQLLSEQSLILSVPLTAQYIFRGGEFMRPYGPTPWHYTKMQT